MGERNLKSRIIHLHDTEANWNLKADFIPKIGEFVVYDKDINFDYERVKIGDGTTTLQNLPFILENELNGIVYAGDDSEAAAAAPYDADTLGGIAAENYALKTDIPEFDDTLSIENCIADAKVVGEKFSETTSLVKRVGNPYNLLDNSDFRNPVNQRGQTSYSGAVYTIDRWLINGGTLTVNNGVSFDHAYVLYQLLEKNIADGVKRTLAIGTNDGAVYYQIISAAYMELGDSGYSCTYDTGIAVYISRVSDNALPIVWAALYEGEYTLETLPNYQPKGYGAELMECQRYYYKQPASLVFNGLITSSCSVIRGTFTTPSAMITKPNLLNAGLSGLRTVTGTNSNVTITSSTVAYQSYNSLMLEFNIETFDTTNNTPISCYITNVELSADL